MRGWQGFALGFLGLTLLEITVANTGANQRVGGILSGVGSFFQKFLDPTVPALKPIANTAATSGPGGSSVSSVTVPLSELGTGATSGPASSPTASPSTINLTPTQQATLGSGSSFLG